MPNGNPFMIDPSLDVTPALAGLGQTIERIGERKRAEARFNEVQGAMQGAWRSGDPNKMMEVSIQYPEARETMQMAFGMANKETAAISRDTYQRILVDPENAEEHLTRGIEGVSEYGGRPNSMMSDLGMWRRDPKAAYKKIMMSYAATDPEGFKYIKEGVEKKLEKPEYQMGTGPMAGYKFDKTTGKFSIDPEVKAALDRDAQEKAGKKGMLQPKDIAGINDKVTALTKDVRGISTSAKSLEKLKERGSAASKLAAVFKFMKVLDPTSVVRETEQGQVYSAQGAGRQLAGKINALLGEGELTEAGFQDIVDTAKSLANSAIEASEGEVTDYLSVLEDKIPAKDLEGLRRRVPERIDTLDEPTEDSPEAATVEDLVSKYADKRRD